ncbi:ATP-binding protein [Psychromonas sp. 14N.309.X.WAT.B.A12]|uniref:ATP-binding protein n=1 Tax=Psychromonas sp. 14N.309.X.WAT.B.A12 TaxID=2998322 RepID=UPI0025B1194A|nr:ATP-binding protein [Psychromonas sp. 14N.309.X.WAT.B.A12]MDN2662086.1 ATP-binding protein [Psychromonas sp. 14N.309.X.WAT.B.A12]
MAHQAYQLLRIIIIDSFWKGQVNELDLSGHTQLEGTNGAGKTSLMRLLPLFYGMRPSDIVSKVDQAKNFADYYLPRDSSMLVYEYRRPGGQTCMALASSDGRGVQFKFIDSGFDSKIFIGENKIPLSVAEVERVYRSLGVECSVYLGVDKYRQVIQNLRIGRKVKEIRQLQNRFSFSDLATPHLDKVVNGTIEKNLDFDAVKQMLVAIAGDHIARSVGQEKEQITLNKQDISLWLADIQASRSIQKVSDKITLWQTDFNQLDNLLIKLQHLHVEMLAHQESINLKQTERSQQKSQLRDEITQLDKQLKDQTLSLQTDINKLLVKIEADQSRIDLLDEDKLKFDENDAASFQLQADNAPRYQQALNDVNEIIEAFEGNLNKVQAKFESLLQTLTLQKVKDEARNHEQVANVKEQANTQLSIISETYQGQLGKLNEQLNDSFLKLNMDLQLLQNDLKITESAQKNISVEPALQAEIESNQLNMSDVKDRLSDLLQVLSSDNEQLNTLEKQRTLVLEQHTKNNRQLDEHKKSRQQLHLQLLPEANSLHHFLSHENEAQGWKDNIGRVLSAEQLARKDLNPQWVAEQGGVSSLFGLQIDLDQLQDNDLQLNENELREKLTNIDDKIASLSDKSEQFVSQISDLTKQIEQQKLVISERKQALQKTELQRQQFKTQQDNLLIKKQHFLKQAAASYEDDIKKLNTKIKQQQAKLTEFKELQQEQRFELNNQMLDQRMVVESDRDSQLDQLAEQFAAIQESAKNRQKDYKQQRDQALDKLDPDGEVDKRIKQRAELMQQLEECAVWARKAREYEDFMNNRYINRDQLVEQNQNREVQKRSLENSLSDLTIEKTSLISEKQKLLKKVSQQLNDDADLLLQLSLAQRECEQYGIEPLASSSEPSNNAELTVTFCGDWVKQFKTIDKRLQSQITQFNTAFAKNNANSELYENWIKLVADNDIYKGARSLFKYQNPIADLLSSAAQKQKNTYQLVTVNANMINEFYQHIEHFARRIKSIGKQLSNNVTKLAHFEALADINVNTVMKQEELDYWGPLQQFAKLFDKYRDDLREGVGDIPDDLIVAMQKLSAYLPSEGFALAHHQLFDIEFTISEKGQLKHARNARQLKKISSTGLSYLAMLSLYAGILGMLRGESDAQTQIILPVDELGELAAENIDLLLTMFNDNAITMLSASPSTDRHILSLYERHYKIKDNKIFHAHIPTSRLDELLMQRKQVAEQANQTQTTELESQDV